MLCNMFVLLIGTRKKRESHLAIRRKDYQLQKQRVANNAANVSSTFTPLALVSSAVDKFQGSTSLDNNVVILSSSDGEG